MKMFKKALISDIGKIKLARDALFSQNLAKRSIFNTRVSAGMSRYTSEENFEKRFVKLHPNSDTEHKYSLIWLHGRAESAYDYKDLFADETLAIVPKTCRVIIPTAPTIPVTCNRGRMLTAWYDIITLDRPASMPLDEVLLLHN